MVKEERNLSLENQKLKQENKLLKKEIYNLKLALKNAQKYSEIEHSNRNKTSLVESNTAAPSKAIKDNSSSAINKYASPAKKISLYNSLFKGRSDVYAEKFIHSKTNKPGYAPKKRPYWERTDENPYVSLTPHVINQHLTGQIIAGLFPITLDDKCYLLAIDLDGNEWMEDVKVIREVCSSYTIPISVERSQSGNGGHCWFFFETEVNASIARKMGTELIKQSMVRRHELDFASFDRLFPNQDTVPKGGLGNLIALPLQKQARQKGNSLFIDNQFDPIEDQWAYLSSIKKITPEQLFSYIDKLREDNSPYESGDKESDKGLNNNDFPKTVKITLGNMLQIEKKDISSKGLSHLKWMAAFYNPEFYQLQAMRRSTYRVQRVITCHEETTSQLLLPRGLKEKVVDLLEGLNIFVKIDDVRNKGEKLSVQFNGDLRPEQAEAVKKMNNHDTGVLCGSTAFGKTIAAIDLIAEKKVNTLILVNKVSLANQWRKRMQEFMMTEDSDDEIVQVGQLGGGKKTLTNQIDIALLQSLYRKGEVHECVDNYGMIIVDECHHISAFSFENVLKKANPTYVYGLTATPVRKDGHHPIIHMQCGDIRYQDDVKKVAEERPFSHVLVPRFTPLDPTLNRDANLQSVYSDLITNESRNKMIVEDIVSNSKENRNGLVLSERIEHVKTIETLLKEELEHVYVLSGSQGKKKNESVMNNLENLPENSCFTIVSTGKYIGEGFDESRLDSLFLAMPISWKGRLQQYAGRLHRLHEGKSEVRVYDYADIHVPVLERMYQKRLKGYAGMGYEVQTHNQDKLKQLIFDGDNYYDSLKQDLVGSVNHILISSPSLSQKQIDIIKGDLSLLKSKITIITKNSDTIKNAEHRQYKIQLITELTRLGFSVINSDSVYQRYVIVDHSIIWYGSIDLLGRQYRDSSFMRIESPVLAREIEQITKENKK
ncbi:TOTE conflict system archaeo-eukaryotic primase domain-containing protein [Alkalibacterium olivapovliticus]|uniref:Helicase ATP-binding domain-containing protein n=1 Tax=Alkalibacterium olivapovliticus TaxID=99907 RepID=A0A2T0VUM5_9LACT|nr:DEAD/DEAH box helicase family protein [Alkalibacterium olivapovliticus]PRY75082.1 hypothetical protein CLV38_1377 [Alkalibacterium olivapovliticus]